MRGIVGVRGDGDMHEIDIDAIYLERIISRLWYEFLCRCRTQKGRYSVED